MTLALEVSEDTQRFFAEHLKPWRDQIQARIDAATTEAELSTVIAQIVLEVSAGLYPPTKTGELQ